MTGNSRLVLLKLCLKYISDYIKDDARITLEVAEKDYYDVKDAPAFRDDIIKIVKSMPENI